MLRFVVLSIILSAAFALFNPEHTKSPEISDNGRDTADDCPDCMDIYHKFGERVDGDK